MSIGLLKVMVNAELTGTFVCPLTTLLLTTYGAAKSGPASVLKCVVLVAAATPA